MPSTQTDTSPFAEVECVRLPFEQTGRFAALVLDYLKRSQKLEPFINRWPSMEGLAATMRQRADGVDRGVLVDVLKKQYHGIKKSPVQIDWLKEENTFTVTTGHQLNLFTGPVFFIYKIASAIRLCQELQEHYEDKRFVPVFWMASEDHDFDEIDHAWVNGRKLGWESGQNGAVGRMQLDGIEEVIGDLQNALPEGFWREQTLSIVSQAYAAGHTLAQATRIFVHRLFGEYGLVILDADDAALKARFAPVMKKELFSPFVADRINQTSEKLNAHYKLQLTPREINLFYLFDGFRDRIVKRGEGFEAINGGPSFTQEELMAELDSHPERFSPNAAMRPMYQESILPNLAYVGGGGELAYWFQLKEAFIEANISFPVLVLRNSMMLCNAKVRKRVEQLNLEWPELFETADMLEKLTVLRQSASELSLAEERKIIGAMLDRAEEQLSQSESTLRGSAQAVKAKVEKLITRLEKKWIREEKRNQQITINRLNEVMEALFPQGELQERHRNMLEEYVRRGPAFIDMVMEFTRPLEPAFNVLVENKK